LRARAPRSFTWCSRESIAVGEPGAAFGELVHEVAGLGHGLDGERVALGHAAHDAHRRLAVDEHLLHEVRLGEQLEVARVLRRVEAQEAETGLVGVGLEVDVVELHVHHEVVGGEERLGRLGIVALLGRHRQRRGAALGRQAVHGAQHPEGGGGARGAAQELAPGDAEAARAPIGLLGEEPRGGALARARRPGAPLAVRHVGEREREVRLVFVASHRAASARPRREGIIRPWKRAARRSRP
jgi:hypothetical protein